MLGRNSEPILIHKQELIGLRDETVVIKAYNRILKNDTKND